MHDWNDIVDHHGPQVWRAIYRILNDHAESLDCYQEVFLEAFERFGNQEVHNWLSVLRWLGVRRAIDRLRSRKRRGGRYMTPAEPNDIPATAVNIAGDAEWKELLQQLCDALLSLPDQQAEAFWMSCIEEMSYKEIGERLDLDVNRVGIFIHRAKRRLRSLLAQFNPHSYVRCET